MKVDNIIEDKLDISEDIEEPTNEEVEKELEEIESIGNLEDSLSSYLNESRKYPLLSNTEIEELFKEYLKTNSKEIRNKIVNHNLRLAIHVAKKYRSFCKSMTLLDLIQECNLALVKAVEGYDISKGIKLSTYATNVMKRNILREIDNKDSMIRKPVHIEAYKTKYNKFLETYYYENKGFPTDDEIKKELDISDDVLDVLKNINKLNADSLNKKLESKENDEDELENFVPFQENGYSSYNDFIDTQILLKAAQELLTKREYYTVYERIISDEVKTLKEISKEFNSTGEWVRHIEVTALEKLNRNIKLKQKQVSGKYSIKNLEKMNLKPLSPSEISTFHYLKDNLDEITYYFLYTMMVKNYNLDNYQKKFRYLSFNEIKEIVSSCLELENEFFKEENRYNLLNKYLKKYTSSQIFDLDIEPKITINYQEIMSFIDQISFEEIEKTDYYKSLSNKEKSIINRYYYTPVNLWKKNSTFERIERDINLFLLGYDEREKSLISTNEIKQIIKDQKERFTSEELEYIENNILNKRGKVNYNHYNYYQRKLLKIKLRIHNFFDNAILLEQLEYIKNKYRKILTEEEWILIDKYYGYNTHKKSIKDLAVEYNLDYVFIHDKIRNLRERILLKYYNLEREEQDIDGDIFIKFLLDNRYVFSDEQRKILRKYIIEKKDYKQIANEEGYSNYKISNFITDGIRKLNFYKYRIIQPVILDKDEIIDFMIKNNYSEEEINIIIKNFIDGIDLKQISCSISYAQKTLLKKRFYEDYLNSKIGNLSYEQYKNELDCHISDSILTEKERLYVSLRFGIEYERNKEGKKYNIEEITKILEFSKTTYIKMKHDIDVKIKERLLNLKYPRYGLISRKKMEYILRDKNLPISDKERNIICHIKELNGYEYKSPEELAEDYGNLYVLNRRFDRAILSILQYKDKRKKSQISYEKDIKPNLKYFSSSDENILNMYYKDKLTIEEISKRLNISLANGHDIMRKLNITLREVINDEKTAKKFDFEYARSVLDKKDLPLVRDEKNTLINIFKLITGEGYDRKYSVPEIKEKLGIDYAKTTINNMLYTVMIAIEKYKVGIRKKELVTHKEICEFYKKNKDAMNKTQKSPYESYFKKYSNKKLDLNSPESKTSKFIVYDILKDKGKLVFTLKDKTREYMKNYAIKNKGILPNSTIKAIKEYYEIPEKEIMTGKEKEELIKIMRPLYLMAKSNKQIVKEK